jgi:hypothetical protein
MSIGSITASTIASAYDVLRAAAESQAAVTPPVAAPTAANPMAEEQGPIRSVSATQGTMVDTYL